MQPAFHKYLALYKKLDVPGIGNFTIETVPATLQFTDKQWQAPNSHIRFAPVVHPTNNHFYTFLSREWEVDKAVAIRRYKEEVENILDELKKIGMCEWKGIGILRRITDGTIAFAASEYSLLLFAALPAERVLRKHTHHNILVGEQEQVKEYIMPDTTETVVYEEEIKKDKWQLYALLLAIAAVLMVVFYYATKSPH